MVGKLYNHSDSTVYLKSENGNEVIPVLPGQEHPMPPYTAGFDGFWTSQRPDEVYKVRGTPEFPFPDVTVTNQGPDPFGPDVVYEILQLANFKDEKWLAEHPDWNDFVDRAKDKAEAVKQPEPASSGGGGDGGGHERDPSGGFEGDDPSTGWHEGPGGGHLWTGGNGSTSHGGLNGLDNPLMETPETAIA